MENKTVVNDLLTIAIMICEFRKQHRGRYTNRLDGTLDQLIIDLFNELSLKTIAD